MGKLLVDPYVRGAALNRIPVVLLGFGKVGRAFATLVEEREGFAADGVKVGLVGIFDRSGGVTGDDLPLRKIVAHKVAAGVVASIPQLGREGAQAGEALSRYPAAILVDASPTDPETGEPGLSLIRGALKQGHSVVLASKGPLVASGRDLLELAARTGCRIGISAAVGTPLPSMEILHLGLRGAGVRGFRGIFSTAANRILADMETGLSYDKAMENAGRAGLLETDPRLDVEGWDTAFKILILARFFWRADLPLESVQREGITEVTPADLARNKESGYRLRLVGSATRTAAGELTLRVETEALPPTDPLHALDPDEKGAEFDTDLMGSLFVKTSRAGPSATAAALVKDILNIAAHPAGLAL